MSFDEDYDRPPVTFVPVGQDDEEREENLEMVKPSPGSVSYTHLTLPTILLV